MQGTGGVCRGLCWGDLCGDLCWVLARSVRGAGGDLCRSVPGSVQVCAGRWRGICAGIRAGIRAPRSSAASTSPGFEAARGFLPWVCQPFVSSREVRASSLAAQVSGADGLSRTGFRELLVY